jgi:hypothetical protein
MLLTLVDECSSFRTCARTELHASSLGEASFTFLLGSTEYAPSKSHLSPHCEGLTCNQLTEKRSLVTVAWLAGAYFG